MKSPCHPGAKRRRRIRLPFSSLEKAYFDSGYDITAMLRVLFTSDFFKAPSVRVSRE